MKLSPTVQIWIEYFCVALIILFPLLMSGYILTIDMVFTPHISFPTQLTNTYPLDFIMWLLSNIFPADVVQKAILVAIIVFSGVSMHLFAKFLLPLLNNKKQISHLALYVAPYAAGLFYIFNPFVYSRFMSGQWLVLLGYALLPFFMRSLAILAQNPSVKQGFFVGLWAATITAVSLHHSGMIVIIAFIIAIAMLIYHKWHVQKIAIRAAASALLSFMLLSSYWLFPAIFGLSSLQESASFDASHFETFATKGQTIIGQIAHVIRLQGFWLEAQHLFLLPQQLVPFWGLLFIGWWVLIAVGARYFYLHAKVVFWPTLAVLLVGILLAATPLLHYTSDIPFISGYREPHKFTQFVALSFCIFSAGGALAIISKCKTKPKQYFAIGAIIALPFILAAPMLGGFSGQLQPRQYPADWLVAKQKVSELPQTASVVFLPWHQYGVFNFSERLIATPAEKFFSKQVIASDDPELNNISPTIPNAQKAAITAIIKNQPNNKKLELLQNLGITHILFAKEQDYEQYTWLTQLNNVETLYDSNTITLYDIQRSTP